MNNNYQQTDNSKYAISRAKAPKCFNIHNASSKQIHQVDIIPNNNQQSINLSNHNLLTVTKSECNQLPSSIKRPMTISEKFQLDFKQLKHCNATSKKHLQSTKRSILTQSITHMNIFKTASSSLSLSPNRLCFSNSKTKSRNRLFNIDKDKLTRQSKEFYLTTAISGTFLKKCSQLAQLKQFSNHMIVLYENIQYFQKTFLIGNAFKTAFNNMNNKQQIKVNKTIEDLCAITLEFLRLLLTDFTESMNQIIYSKIPNIKAYRKETNKNEEDTLQSNLKLLNEVSLYLDSCIEVIKMIIGKEVRLSLTKEDIQLIKIYLDQSRYKASNIIAIAENYIEKTKEDILLLKTFEEKAFPAPTLTCSNSNNNEERTVMSYFRKSVNMKKGIMNKIFRVDNVLNIQHKKPYSKEFLIKKRIASLEINKETRSSILNSQLINKLIKYLDKPIRERIIATRIKERYEKYND